jgi:hypothetical protein
MKTLSPEDKEKYVDFWIAIAEAKRKSLKEERKAFYKYFDWLSTLDNDTVLQQGMMYNGSWWQTTVEDVLIGAKTNWSWEPAQKL